MEKCHVPDDNIKHSFGMKFAVEITRGFVQTFLLARVSVILNISQGSPGLLRIKINTYIDFYRQSKIKRIELSVLDRGGSWKGVIVLKLKIYF